MSDERIFSITSSGKERVAVDDEFDFDRRFIGGQQVSRNKLIHTTRFLYSLSHQKEKKKKTTQFEWDSSSIVLIYMHDCINNPYLDAILLHMNMYSLKSKLLEPRH